MKVELLRRFVVLAEELNFTRAAQRLHIAQQVLSTQIKDLERRVGARLLGKTPHRFSPTPAGDELLAAVQSALATLDDGIARTRLVAGAPEGRLRIGFVAQGAAEFQAPLMRELRRRHPQVVVELHSFSFSDPYGGLLTGQSDVAFLRHALPHADVCLERISEESRIVLVPEDHPFAARPALQPDDLAGQPAIVVRGHTGDPILRHWMAIHTLEDEIGRRPVGAVVETPEEWLQAAWEGRGFTTTPASVVKLYPRPGLVGVVVTGVSNLAFMVGWRRALDGSPLAADVVELARAAARAPTAPSDPT